MLTVAIGLFLLGAVFGLFALFAILNNKTTPKVAVFVHGALVTIGFGLVMMYTALKDISEPVPLTSLILLAISAIGGLSLLILDLSGKIIPKPLALLHPLIGVCAVLSLILFVAGI